MITICCATNRDLRCCFLVAAFDQIGAGRFPRHIPFGEFRLQHAHHRIGAAQRLEGSQAEARSLILVMQPRDAGGLGDGIECHQRGRRIAGPGGDLGLGAGIAAFGQHGDAGHAMVAVQEITERALFDHAPILRPSAPRAKPCTVTGRVGRCGSPF